MSQSSFERIENFIRDSLASHGDAGELDPDESLFLSGRLDSLTVTRLVVFLEEQFGVDFGRHSFDVGELDSIRQIATFSEQYGAAAAE